MCNLNNGRYIKSGQKGFTLLEIMVAVAIIAIAFTSLLKLHTQSVTMDITSNFYTKAPLLAEKKISEWEIAMITGNPVPDSENESEKDFPNFSSAIHYDQLDSDSVYTENPEKDSSRLFEINCTVSYNNGEYNYTVKSLRFYKK